VEAFAGNVTVQDAGDLAIELDVLQQMISQTPMASISVNITGLKVWTVLDDPGVMTLTVTLPYGGRVSFVENQAGRTLATVGANNVPGAGLRAITRQFAGSPSSGMFLWRIGQLPIPDVMVDYIPATHALGQWVRKNNKLALNHAIQRGMKAGKTLML
jgi:hypothetical protein